ncbi:hypothetical protein BRC87_02005 [Halobacteriales archaeon QS_4_66_20]|nr:MAG: hypothetical protein BRC87_02005 [Halobacteriales archaeon QS_4_66_20]
MSTLDGVSGAGLLVDAEYRIRGANERCVVVFEESVSEIRGNDLGTLREMGLCDRPSVRRWECAVGRVLNGEVSEATERVTLHPDGDTRQYEVTVRPFEADRAGAKVRCALRSVDDDSAYDETLRALHGSTRRLLAADTVEQVLERTAEAANEVLGFPGTAVRRYDPSTQLLHHVSFGSRIEDLEDRPPYHVEESPHGRALTRRETVIDEIGDDDPYDREVFTQTMYVPIGSRALLSVGTIDRSFDESDVQFAEILAENATAAVQTVTTAERLRREQEHLELLRQILTRVLRHNIRNDMNVIESNAELIDELTREEITEHVERICASVDSVTSLSEKAREIEQIADDPDQSEEVDLSAIVESAVARVSRAYPDATIETTAPDQCRIAAHRSLGVALRNLLENACEHADTERSTVEVVVAETDAAVTISICDDGPGIPDSELEILEREGETALQHGSGLGLWVVKWVIERSDASIEFDTTDGTCVEVRLERTGSDGR